MATCCCSPCRPAYKRHVDAIYPAAAEDGLVKNKNKVHEGSKGLSIFSKLIINLLYFEVWAILNNSTLSVHKCTYSADCSSLALVED